MKQKIVIVGPCLTMGGMERASVNLANAISNRNLDVTYISIFKKEHFLKLNKSINLIEPPNGLNKHKINLLKTIFWLRKSIIKTDPNSILVFNKLYGAITAFSLIFLKTSFYISERSSPLYRWSVAIKIFNKIAYWIYPPDGVVSQTKTASIYHKKYYAGKTKIRVIPNALREVKLYPEIKRQKQVLAVGRLNDHLKGFDRLIEAFGRIENREWVLVFAGGDAEGSELKRQAKDHGIDERTFFVGKINDIDRVYAESGLFVIPSRSEGFPNALCEAMAAGLPCISFNFIAGPSEIITNGHDGLIIEDNNISALTSAIDSLIDSEAERSRLGNNALQIRDRLKMEKIGQEYLDFILKL